MLLVALLCLDFLNRSSDWDGRDWVLNFEACHLDLVFGSSFVEVTYSLCLLDGTPTPDRATDHGWCESLVDLIGQLSTHPLLLARLHFDLQVLLGGVRMQDWTSLASVALFLLSAVR